MLDLPDQDLVLGLLSCFCSSLPLICCSSCSEMLVSSGVTQTSSFDRWSEAAAGQARDQAGKMEWRRTFQTRTRCHCHDRGHLNELVYQQQVALRAHMEAPGQVQRMPDVKQSMRPGESPGVRPNRKRIVAGGVPPHRAHGPSSGQPLQRPAQHSPFPGAGCLHTPTLLKE